MTGPGVVVRPATEADLPALAAVESASFTGTGSPAWSRDQLAGELAQPTALVVVAIGANDEVDESSALLGYAALRHVGPEAELLRVAVAPEARSRGVGRLLVDEGLARLRERGVATCFLEVRPGNTPALALYQRLGFRTVDRRRRYFADGADALVLRLDLERSGRG